MNSYILQKKIYFFLFHFIRYRYITMCHITI